MRHSLKMYFLYGSTVFVILCSIFILVTETVRSSPPPQEQPSHTSDDAGRSAYQFHCSPCHGTNGKGTGILAYNLSPKPRDLTQGIYKFRSTKTGSIPTDEDILRTIRNGLHGTSMPSMSEFITGDTLSALLRYVKSFSQRFTKEQEHPVMVSSPIPTTEKSIANGKLIYEKLECANCHGIDGSGTDAVATDLSDIWGNTTKATNLQEPWLFRGGSTTADVYMRLKTGIDGTPMPSYEESADDNALWDAANYVVSLARKPVWQMSVEELTRFYSAHENNDLKNPVERGKYLVESFGCADCHSPFKEGRVLIEEFRMAGGSRWTVGPYGDFITPNLTSDKETGIGNWSDDEIKNAMTKGILKDGRRMLPFPMPWTSYANLKENDLRAIIAYLRTLPPVYNKIPPHETPGIFTYLWGKFEMLVMKKDIALRLSPGNAGSGK